MGKDKIKSVENEKIIVKNISKNFDFEKKQNSGFLAKLLFWKDKTSKKINAINDVSFKAMSKENVGIIGKNGSGKSTLLRILAKVYSPDSGEVEAKGKVIFLSGLGHGLKSKLTMKDNIFLVGSILGLSQKSIKDKLDEIVEFSGLEEFVDMKLYKFSSGMVTRLNFSIGVHCLEHHNPDILLLDEVFSAGGDIEFKEKVTKKMQEFLSKGTTIIMASHDLVTAEKHCDKIIWLDKGSIKKQGKPSEVLEEYKAENSKV